MNDKSTLEHELEDSLVAVEPFLGDGMVLYGHQDRQTVPFSPWLLLEAQEDSARAGLPGIRELVRLRGGGQFRIMVRFQAWQDFQEARVRLSESGIPYFFMANPVHQHMLLSGRTLFRGMRYSEIHRLQLDIETLSLNPKAVNARIILVALSDSRGYEEILGHPGMTESALLEVLNRRIKDRDPDVIEGHNIFDFDLTYISVRAEKLGVPLPWGRDVSVLRLSQGPKKGRGLHASNDRRAYVHGRHFIDTLNQIQRYDHKGRLERYGLKRVVLELGIQREDRTFVEPEDISRLWRDDPKRLSAYALDDVRDVRRLSEIISPTEFYQAQLLPYSYQETATTGTGEKINTLMVGSYLRRGLAIPCPHPPRPFPGGYTEMFSSGVFQHVVKADVQSLYPSIMLNYRVRPASDSEDLFLPMLEKLTRRRLEAKAKLQGVDSESDRSYWEGLQSSYKILINSFYGYLAYARANFNDYAAAERVTTLGQEIARQMVAMLERKKATVIEVDTDGAYFVAPSNISTEKAEKNLVESVSEELPSGIHLSHDGRYRGMISLKAKNYVLVGYNEELIMKGSSLRSRRDERAFRSFLRDFAHLLIDRKLDAASSLYRSLADRLEKGEVDPQEFCHRETVTEKTFSNPQLSRLAEAAEGVPVGERIAVYQREDGSLARVESYDGDEDRNYLLRRLHDMAGRFRALFEDDSFRRLFPLVQTRPREQLTLF